MKRYWWIIPAVLVSGVVLVWQLPADRLTPTFISAIERGLHRKVEVNGEVSFVPWRFGFSIADVVIHDDPRFGLEPLAYVDTLEATVRWTALLAGRFEIDRLRLVGVSVNLAQGNGSWNFPALLNEAAAASRTVAPPEVEVGGGLSRLNIRFGENKSPYYLDDVNLTIEPGGKPGELSVYFDGVPARTDRSTKGFGRLSGRGTVGLTGDRVVNLNLSLARSAASELLLLFQDRGSSVAGFFSGTARVAGPLIDMKIEGKLGLHEFERWGWLISRGANGPGLEWTGTLNWDLQKLHLETKAPAPTAPATEPPVAMSVDADHLLGPAVWQSKMMIRDAPASALEQLAQQFGFALPGGTQLGGELNGEVGYATGKGLSGSIDFSGGSLAIAGKMAQVEPASVYFQGATAKLAPVVIREDDEVLRMEASYLWPIPLGTVPVRSVAAGSGIEGAGTPGLSWAFSGSDLDLGRAHEWNLSLPGRIQSGRWHGNLRYEAATGGWQGEGDLTDAELDTEGLTAHVHLDTGHVKLEGARFGMTRMAGKIDDVALRGEFQFDPNAPLRSQLRAQLGAVTADQLRSWIAPALERNPGVLSRTLGLGAVNLPDWIADRRLAAQIQFDSVDWNGVVVGPLTVRSEWRQGVVRLLSLTGPGRLRGSGDVVISAPETDRKSQIMLENVPWRGGLANLLWTFDLQRGPRRAQFVVDANDTTLIEGERWARAHLEGEFDPVSNTASFDRIELQSRFGDPASTLSGTGQATAKGDWDWNLHSAAATRHLAGPGLAGIWHEVPAK